MHELELKLEVPAERRAEVEERLFSDAPSETLSASYFDTADRRLAARQVALRLRKEGSQWVQTLKAGADNPLRRLEHNVSVQADGDAEPALDPARHAGTPAGSALKAALVGADDAALQKLYSTDIVRRIRVIDVGASRVEVAFDTGAIRANGQEVGVCEIEIEVKSGPPEALVTLARRWVLEHGLWLSISAKSARGDRLSRGAAHAPVATATAAAITRKMGGEALLRATLDACITQVLANASEVAAGSTSEDHVHQLRVGIRRLRTALRELGPLAEGLDPAWEVALVGLFRQLGQLRDRDTVTHGARAELSAAGAPVIALPEPELAAPDVQHAVRSLPVQMALLGLIGFGLELEKRAADGDRHRKKTLRYVRRRLDKLHRQVVRDGRRFETLPVEAQHQVRKRLKRLRYLGEFVAPLFKRSDAHRYFDTLRPAQDALGKHNDAAVALEAYRHAAAHDPNAWFAVGWLAAQSMPTSRRCRKALAKIEGAPRFWYG